MSITSPAGPQTMPRPAPTSDPARLRSAKLRKRKIITWVLAALVIAVGVGLYLRWKAGASTNPYANMQTAAVDVRDIDEIISATGSVTAQTGAEVKIGSQITGVIKRLHADVGSHVNAGDVIAELDLPDVEAQVAQARANLQAAEDKLQQQREGYGQTQTTSRSGIQQALANLSAARAKYNSAVAASTMQPTQTNSDIARAQAALSSAKSALQQTNTSALLQIHTADAQLRQAQASAKLAADTAKRQRNLANQHYIAEQDAEIAETQAQVDAEAVSSAVQNRDIVTAKVANDKQAASDLVTQAQANLSAARSERFNNVMKTQDAQNAAATVNQMNAALAVAHANIANNSLKVQDIKTAQDAVATAQAQLKIAQAQYAKTSIRTPISGTVIELAQQQGETIAAGLSAPTVIIVADLNRLQVDAFVDETDIGKVHRGQPADVTVDAYPTMKFPGHVAKIASGSTIQQTVVTYDVTIALDQPAHGLLKPDMTANVNIHVGSHPQVLAAPNEAIKSQPNGSAMVLVVDNANHPHHHAGAGDFGRPGSGGAPGSGPRRSRGAGGPGAGAAGPRGAGGPGAAGRRGPGAPGGGGGPGKGGAGRQPNYPVGPDGTTLVQVPVTTGATDGSYTEITSGLKAGDVVATAGAPGPVESSHLTFTPFGARRVGGGGGGGRRGG